MLKESIKKIRGSVVRIIITLNNGNIVSGTGFFIQKNKFIFLLGGEHSVSIGVFQALAKKYNLEVLEPLDDSLELRAKELIIKQLKIN